MNQKKAFSLIELMIVIVIGLLITTATVYMARPARVSSNLKNQLNNAKSAFMLARARAVETSSPVRLQYTADDRLLILRDTARDGSFDDVEVLKGDSANLGALSPYADDIDFVPGSSDYPSEYNGIALDLSPFPDNSFIVLPDGTVISGDPAVVRGGTLQWQGDKGGGEIARGLVYISSKGEMHMARKKESTDEWIWID